MAPRVNIDFGLPSALSNLGLQPPSHGNKIVIDVGFKGVDNPGAVIGGYSGLAVNVPDWVNNDAAPCLLGPDYEAVV